MAEPPTSRPSKARLRRLRPRLLALAASLALAWAVLELVLRLAAPALAPALGQVGNYVYTAYHRHANGIYFGGSDRELRLQFMRPDFEATNYWNGYFWHHATDRWGFRNPPGTPAEVLVAGDSFVYGHGVEEEDTLTARLRRDHGIAAYNLGRQGDCLYQEYVLLRIYLDEFRPREVVLTVFVNDFEDLLVYRTPEQLAARPEMARGYAGEAERIAREGRDVDHDLEDQLLRSRALRLLAGAAKQAGLAALPGRVLRGLPAPRVEAAPAVTDTEPRPPWADAHSYLLPILDWDRFLPLLEYHEEVLGDLARRTAERGARLSVVFVEHPDDDDRWTRLAQRRVNNQLRRLCGRLGIPYRSLQPALRGCETCFLPGDGHFSPEGHRRVADFLAAEVLGGG